MQLIRGPHNYPAFPNGSVITIGNFDGVHLGHQTMLKQTTAIAKQHGVPAVLLSFEPTPAEYFHSQTAPTRLMSWREKWQYLQGSELDVLLLLRFREALAQLRPEAFVQQLLLTSLQMKHLIIGEDFRFGYQRKGDFALLQTLGDKHGFRVSKTMDVTYQGQRISSSWIRQCLAAGDLPMAEKLLGRPYQLSGRVKHGHKRGRSIGVPTANLHISHRKPAISGVYAVKIHDLPEGLLCGVANIGTRPTIGGTRVILEVHLFHFDRDIYGEHLRVEFCQKLRDEVRYTDFKVLQQQIYRDIAAAKDCLQVAG